MNKKVLKACDKSNQLVSDSLRALDLYEQHLQPCKSDFILLILKGHLIIEHLLEINLVRLLSIEHLPEGGDLEFSQKLKLVQAVVMASKVGPNADLFCVIAKLNQVRNKLAHNLLSEEQIKIQVQTLIQSYQGKTDKKLDSESLEKQLKNCMLRLISFLLKVRKHFIKLEIE